MREYKIFPILIMLVIILSSCKINASKAASNIDSVFLIAKKESDFSIINLKNTSHHSKSYEFIDSCYEGLFRVKKNGKWGFIDLNYKETIDTQYQKAMNFSDGLAGIQIDGKWGFIDANNNVQIAPQYDWVSGFKEGYAFVLLNDTYYIITKNGETYLKTNYSLCKPIYKDAVMAIDKGTQELYLISYNNVEIANFGSEAKEVVGYSDDRFCVKFAEKDAYTYKVFDKNKNLILENLDMVTAYYESTSGYAIRQENNVLKWGLLNLQGVNTEPQFNNIIANSEGLLGASVLINDEELFGYIDNTGEFVIEPKYNLGAPMLGGYAPVAIKDTTGKLKWGIITNGDEFLIEPKYDLIFLCRNSVWQSTGQFYCKRIALLPQGFRLKAGLLPNYASNKSKKAYVAKMLTHESNTSDIQC